MKTPDNFSREEIKTLNEAIAKFIGWFQEENSVEGTWWKLFEFSKGIAYSKENNYPHQDLPFHRDWNYLMPALLKVTETESPVYKGYKHRFVIEGEKPKDGRLISGINHTSIDIGSNTGGVEGTFISFGEDTMMNTWYVLGKFAEWYNSKTT